MKTTITEYTVAMLIKNMNDNVIIMNHSNSDYNDYGDGDNNSDGIHTVIILVMILALTKCIMNYNHKHK